MGFQAFNNNLLLNLKKKNEQLQFSNQQQKRSLFISCSFKAKNKSNVKTKIMFSAFKLLWGKILLYRLICFTKQIHVITNRWQESISGILTFYDLKQNYSVCASILIMRMATIISP